MKSVNKFLQSYHISRLFLSNPHYPAVPNLPPSAGTPTRRSAWSSWLNVAAEETPVHIYSATCVGSLQRRMGRPPVCCIYICNNVCNCFNNEHTFLTRQNIQLNCVSYFATVTLYKRWRAQLVCNSSRTNCLVNVFYFSLYLYCHFFLIFRNDLQEVALNISFIATHCHSNLRPQGNIGLQLERMHIVHNVI